MAEDEAWRTFLLRYGELGIKSDQVRRRFEDQLEANLRRHFAQRGVTALVDRERGRFYIETPEEATGRKVISRTFGLVHASPVRVTDADLDAIAELVRELAPGIVEPDQSFAIRSRRAGSHAFGSPDVAERAGDVVLEAVPEATVDLDDPDVEIHVEVRQANAYVFTEFIPAPGGLPMGSQGLVVVPISGPRSAAAAWLMMRRGSSVHMLVPEGCVEIAETLAPWAPDAPYTVLPGRVSGEGLQVAAAELAERIDANALALGEHEADAVHKRRRDDVAVLRPLAGLPGKRWPDGAYRVAKEAADRVPGGCLAEQGAGPKEAIGLLDEAEEHAL